MREWGVGGTAFGMEVRFQALPALRSKRKHFCEFTRKPRYLVQGPGV